TSFGNWDRVALPTPYPVSPSSTCSNNTDLLISHRLPFPTPAPFPPPRPSPSAMIISELFPNSTASPLRLPADSRSTKRLLCAGSGRQRHSTHRLTGDRKLHFLSLCTFRTTSCVGAVRSSWNSELEAPLADAAIPSGRLGCVVDDGFRARGDSELPAELCVTHTLPPALTLVEAVGKLREEVAKLKANPLHAGSGVLRLQVAVPPSIKPLNWLFSQCRSLDTFPQFYFSRSPTYESGLVSFPDGMVGISGTGAAVYVQGSSCHTVVAKNLIRYLSVDSPLIGAYGFIGIDYNNKTCLVKHDSSSFYIFIPQIEVNEFEGCSILASTLVWDDSLSYTFDKAINAIEVKLCQIVCHVPVVSKLCHENWFHYVHGLSSLLEMKDAEMVHLNVKFLERMGANAGSIELEQFRTVCQAYFRPSVMVAFTSNMLASACGIGSSVHNCANMNAVWALLIVEECVRLGLTYFCIAPGSRSSPLAIAASAHPLTNCISCFDERSLSYHAVGYARGSQMPAVIITSSGTAVSNLLPAVVEASQDFVPTLLLTADRPPELQDAGANQAINQVAVCYVNEIWCSIVRGKLHTYPYNLSHSNL
ncbi:hypothetical protein Taro_023669, partial [Colocasia esculenta]|nr:hypothetical protein [Colocasia esculenta]